MKLDSRYYRVLQVAWPLIIANSFWNIQMTIDRIFLGRYSTDALGAAMAVFGVFWAPMALVQQTAGYVTAFIAQLFGAQREKEIGTSLWQSLYVSLVGGLLFLLLIPITPELFRFMGHAEKMQVLETEYFRSMCYCALPTAVVAAVSGFFTGLGRSSVILWINGIGMVLNTVFNYMLVFGKGGFPALGIAGAGYATAISTGIAAVVGLALVFTSENESRFQLRSAWKFNPSVMKQFLKFGLPSGLQWALEGLAFTVFLLFVGRMPNGNAALSASGIAVTIMMLAVLPAFGVAQAVSVLAGQYLGENRPDEAEKTAWTGFRIAGSYIFFVGLSFLFAPGFYLNWFYNPESQALWIQVAEIVPYLLMYVALFTLFDSMNLVFSLTLKGAGDTRFVSVVALLLPWPIMVLPTWWVQGYSGAIYWAWGAVSLYSITQALIFWRRFHGGKWKSMRVI